MNPRGFLLTIDGATGHAQLACAVCGDQHGMGSGDSEVVAAAVTATFMAAHWQCLVSARAWSA